MEASDNLWRVLADNKTLEPLKGTSLLYPSERSSVQPEHALGRIPDSAPSKFVGYSCGYILMNMIGEFQSL